MRPCLSVWRLLPLALVLPLVLLLPSAGLTTLAAATEPTQVVMASHDPAALFIGDVGRQFPQVIGDAATLDERRRRLTPFVARVVDVEAVGRFCLGRYWSAATPAQRDRYQAVFLKSLVNSIAARMVNYQGGLGHVVVQPPVVHPDGTYVSTLVKGSTTQEVHVAWVVEADRTPMRIVDVVAEGMSLRLARRGDFTAYLAQHGGDIAGFLAALERQTAR